MSYYTGADVHAQTISPRLTQNTRNWPQSTTQGSRIRRDPCMSLLLSTQECRCNVISAPGAEDEGVYTLGCSEQSSALKLLRRTLVRIHTMTADVGSVAPDSQGWPEQLVVK